MIVLVRTPVTGLGISAPQARKYLGVARGLQLGLGHLRDLVAAASGEVRKDLLAVGVAPLDQRDADLVALFRRHLAIAPQRGRDVEAALDQLLDDRQRLVAPAGS